MTQAEIDAALDKLEQQLDHALLEETEKARHRLGVEMAVKLRSLHAHKNVMNTTEKTRLLSLSRRLLTDVFEVEVP